MITIGTVTELPSATVIDDDAEPDATATLLTEILEAELVADGVYVTDENTGDKVPLETARPLSVDTDDAARDTVTTYVLLVTPS